jgi:glycosyltransferase involved in cell wall biosynthesis
MRPVVVHVTNSLKIGGSERGIQSLIANGFYQDCELYLVELVHGFGPIREEIEKLVGHARLISLVEAGTPFSIVRGENGPDPSRRLLPHFVGALNRLLKRLNPSTIVLSLPYTQIVGRLAAMNLSKVKVVSFEHGIPTRAWKGRLATIATSIRDDARFGDSPATLEICNPVHLTRPPAHFVPLTILSTNVDHSYVRHGQFRIVSFGRLAPEKNYVELVKAVATLRSEGRDVHLTIAGEGSERHAIEQTVDNFDQAHPWLVMGRNVRLLGFVSNTADLQQIFWTSHAYVQPSLHEGVGLAYLEAMAAGVPTLTTDFPGARNFGTSRNTMHIMGHGARDIARQLRGLDDHYAEEAPRMGRTSQRIIAENFGAAAVLRQWQPAIAELTSSRKPFLTARRSRHSRPSAKLQR